MLVNMQMKQVYINSQKISLQTIPASRDKRPPKWWTFTMAWIVELYRCW